MTFRVPDEMIEQAAKAIYPLLQDIINHRPLKGHDMPEFQLARAALEAAYWPHPAALALEAEAAKKGKKR